MDKDVEYVLCCDDADEEFNPSGNKLHEQEHDHASTRMKKTKSSTKAKGLEMKQTIAPMSMANFLLMSKKQQRAVVGDKALKKVATAFKAVEQAAMSNQQQLDENIMPNDEETNDDVFTENIYGDTHGDLDDQQFSDDDYDHINFEIEGANQESGTRHTMEDQNLSSGNQVGSNEERRPINPETGTRDTIEDQNLSSGNEVGGNEERRPINPGTMKKTRGIVYCRKLTMLPPGEKLTVEFDNDGIPVGANGSSSSFFLDNQVRNRIVIPVQGVFSFDSPELRKEAILRHARALFRDSRHKLKRKYFDNPKLKTKADRMKNRPVHMLDADWKYLAKSEKSRQSRARQQMPHYNGTQSYAHKEKYRRECSRLDLMLKSRTRTSDKPVNAENLANNMHAKAAMEKLKNEREQGLNDKTDEQIFQEVLGRDTYGYLRAYNRGKSITDYFEVNPSRLDLAQDVMELKKRANESAMEAKKDVEEARKEAEHAKLEAEQAKKEAEEARKEAETTRQEVDARIEANNKMREKKMKNMLEEFLRSSSLGDS
ncbi:hypothetical protein Cgig2_015609 [Carnegiea gigantea]|uniref:Uncharacterized protein n=1 Tax=Carnegiea gigantea TaxID=171969 RepID=A0A9Q1GGE6_9CARY|nr:hypothetical protein Cgig2_015609 [Carnegiea gigantea]